MEGGKILASGIVLGLLIFAAVLTESRVAGEQQTIEPKEPEVLGQQAEAESAAAERAETAAQGKNKSSVKVDIDLDLSSSGKAEVDFSSSVDLPPKETKDTDDEEDGEQKPSSPFSFTINGQTIACQPGETWRSADRRVRCENDQNQEFKIRYRSR